MNIDGKKENNFFNVLAFIVLVITAVLSILGGILDDRIENLLRTVSDVFVLCVLALSAYKFVSKKSKGWKFAYWISFAIYVAGILFIWL